MKSLILTALYLAKDTVNRWFTRVSSPLARVLVVFFLSLCALCFLGSYVISAKVIRDRILSEGGDLVHAVIFPQPGKNFAIPSAKELDELLQADSLAVESIGSATAADRRNISIFTYDFCRSAQMLPLMAGAGAPTLLCPEPQPGAPRPAGIADVTLANGETATVAVRFLPPKHPLLRLMPQGGILVTPDTAEQIRGDTGTRGLQHLLLRVRELNSAEDSERVHRYVERYMKFEGVGGAVSSASHLLREMDVVLGNQMQCRAAFCLGIVSIVGILLTALAGMEYRQNEYIYTLMKSFGIHPAMLVCAFIAENVVLVGAAFAAAVQAFMSGQEIIVRQFFKTAQYSLTLEEIMPEMRLLAISLLVCIACSALPVIAAAHREIGRVLK